jgi:hypothetical protein
MPSPPLKTIKMNKMKIHLIIKKLEIIDIFKDNLSNQKEFYDK